MRLRWLLPVCLLALGCFIPLAAHADTVTDWHDEITVGRDNVTTVKESITYDPQDGSHHGIERTVPATFKDGDGHTYYTRIHLVSITDQYGGRYPIDDEEVDRTQLYARIGDADHTISGPHTYVITYTITPLALSGDGYDRWIFNIVGTDWRTSIQEAEAQITFDTGVSPTTTACYTGAEGSTASDCDAFTAGSSVTAALKHGLSSSQGFTVDLKLPSGTFSTYLKPDTPVPLTQSEKTEQLLISVTWGLSVAIWLFAAARIMWAWWRQRAAKRSHTIIAQYEAPDDLKPAQMALLENAPGGSDITATLIDLAIRGYLKIDLTKTKTWWSSAQYKFTKLKDNDGLLDFEKDLFFGLFGGSNTADTSQLKSRAIEISSAVKKMRKQVGEDLVKKGYFWTKSGTKVYQFRYVFLFISFIALIAPIVDILASLVLLGLSFFKLGRTDAGGAEWAKVEGFKLFLRVTEKDRLAFSDAPARSPEQFSAFLPAAIALGVEKQWAAQFADMDIEPAVRGWYGGYPTGHLGAADFTSGISSGFSAAVSSSFAGASGGGGAGGGGGGGGW